VTVPLGFIACIAGSLLFGRDEVAQASFDEVRVRSTTGIGSEQASSPAGPQSPRSLANAVSS
jgi:hypothetical protein